MAIDIKPVRLVGQHVILEPLTEEHTKGLFEIGRETEDWRYLPIPGFQDMAHAEDWVSEAIKLTQDGQQLAFAQLDPKTLTPIGSTRYMNIRRRDRGLEIGYTFVARAYQRTAVNTESKYLLLQHAFETLGVIRVEFKTDARNLRSQKAIERIGATREGIFRKHMIVQNGYVRDSVYYSIVADEWPRIKADLLSKLASRPRDG
jgi:RimJ/RimL family protein N-acetyltransferase